jgi:2-haloacid dehalogenase
MDRRTFVRSALAAGALTPPLPARLFGAEGVHTPSAHIPASAEESSLQIAESIRMCVFDTFGTVVDWHGSVSAEVNELARRKGWQVDGVAFAEAWRGNYGPSMNRVRSGELPWTDLDGLHRMTLDELLPRFGMVGLTEAEKAHLNRAWHRLQPWPDAPVGLARLRTRYVLSPLSNGNVALLTNMAKFGGLPWDCVLGSDIVRHYKPDPEMYLMPGQFFGLAPSAVLMVAAHPGDLDAAKRSGLRTAYVHRPLERGVDREAPPWPELGRFDFLATDFGDLATQLGVWSLPAE